MTGLEVVLGLLVGALIGVGVTALRVWLLGAASPNRPTQRTDTAERGSDGMHPPSR